jgi:hypothetical protein
VADGGRMEEWKSGRMEEWKDGRVEGWKSGEALAALLPEGVLNRRQNERSEAERGGSAGLCLWRGC